MNFYCKDKHHLHNSQVCHITERKANNLRNYWPQDWSLGHATIYGGPTTDLAWNFNSLFTVIQLRYNHVTYILIFVIFVLLCYKQAMSYIVENFGTIHCHCIDIIEENTFENVVCEMLSISPRSQCNKLRTLLTGRIIAGWTNTMEKVNWIMLNMMT